MSMGRKLLSAPRNEICFHRRSNFLQLADVGSCPSLLTVYVLRVEADADAVRNIPLETERHNSIRERGPIVSGAGVEKVANGKDAENEAKRK